MKKCFVYFNFNIEVNNSWIDHTSKVNRDRSAKESFRPSTTKRLLIKLVGIKIK